MEISCPWYIKPRQFEWFGLFLDYLPTEDPERFKHFFRVSPSTFDSICEMVHDDMVTDPPRRFWSLPNRKLIVQRQVAIALRRLATRDQFVGIGELFGVSTSTVVKVTWKFIRAFNLRGRHLIKWPTGDDITDVKAGFQRRGFPKFCGDVDRTHFPVELVPAFKDGGKPGSSCTPCLNLTCEQHCFATELRFLIMQLVLEGMGPCCHK